jgi:hypothetical protein
MRLRNIYLGIKDQLPVSRLIRNIRTGNVFGLFFKRSHLNFSGEAKITYSSKEKAQKAAAKMLEKKGLYFSNYKCIFCDGFHIGKNRSNQNGNSRERKNLPSMRS